MHLLKVSNEGFGATQFNSTLEVRHVRFMHEVSEWSYPQLPMMDQANGAHAAELEL
jgi:hypothetical protein